MKSQRRHELEQNTLADWLANTIEKTKPYQNAILGGLVLLLVLMIGYTLWTRQAAGQTAESWDQFYAAQTTNNPATYEKVAEQFAGSAAANWALVLAGDLRLTFGCNLLFVNKASANQEIRKAIEDYETLLGHGGESMLEERAVFGLARAYDAQGDLPKATQRYEELTKRWPNGAFAKVAARQVEDLKRSTTKEWYDRFARFDPKPAFEEPGKGGKGPKFDLDKLPEGPVFKPKGAFDLDKDKGAPEPPKDEKPKEGQKAEPAKKPDADAAKKPAAEQKPATDKK